MNNGRDGHKDLKKYKMAENARILLHPKLNFRDKRTIEPEEKSR